MRRGIGKWLGGSLGGADPQSTTPKADRRRGVTVFDGDMAWAASPPFIHAVRERLPIDPGADEGAFVLLADSRV